MCAAPTGIRPMRVLLIHPSAPSAMHLRLEPLDLERIAQAARAAGHEVRIVDLQTFSLQELQGEIDDFRPQAIGFTLNRLADVAEIVDLAKEIKVRLPLSFVFVGGRGASFIAEELLEHSNTAIDCVQRGEREVATPVLLAAIAEGGITEVPGAVTLRGRGPEPVPPENLDPYPPARDLLRRRGKYFAGELAPCAAIEFARGARRASPEGIGAELASLQEPNVFILDADAFTDAEHGIAIAKEIEKRGIRKLYALETRAATLLKNRELFANWKTLGLKHLFLKPEAIEAEALKANRRPVSSGIAEALEAARKLGMNVTVELTADPDWDETCFAVVREWALGVPETMHLTVATPEPGAENWAALSHKLTTRDYRLFDCRHAVLPTRLPLDKFYGELAKTQRAIAGKRHDALGMLKAAGHMARRALQGQANFIRARWKIDAVHNAVQKLADHQKPVAYQMRLPVAAASPDAASPDAASPDKGQAELNMHSNPWMARTEEAAEGNAA
jgi:magnesium-protoporphyrin IX monomethyl ester (oxidative) cyclase